MAETGSSFHRKIAFSRVLQEVLEDEETILFDSPDEDNDGK